MLFFLVRNMVKNALIIMMSEVKICPLFFQEVFACTSRVWNLTLTKEVISSIQKHHSYSLILGNSRQAAFQQTL